MEIKSFHNIPLWFPTIVYFVNWEHSTMSKAFPTSLLFGSFEWNFLSFIMPRSAAPVGRGSWSKCLLYLVGNICVPKLGSTWLLCLHSCSHTLVAKSPYEYQWVSFPPAHLLLLLGKFPHPSLYLILDLYVITVLLLKRGRESSKLGSESNTNYNMLISTTCEKL